MLYLEIPERLKRMEQGLKKMKFQKEIRTFPAYLDHADEKPPVIFPLCPVMWKWIAWHKYLFFIGLSYWEIQFFFLKLQKITETDLYFIYVERNKDLIANNS